MNNSFTLSFALISQYHFSTFSTDKSIIQYHLLHLVSSFQKYQEYIRAFALSVLCYNL
nr:MAG TPA: hypothetical protein [Caudoviricetes sp.]